MTDPYFRDPLTPEQERAVKVNDHIAKGLVRQASTLDLAALAEKVVDRCRRCESGDVRVADASEGFRIVCRTCGHVRLTETLT